MSSLEDVLPALRDGKNIWREAWGSDRANLPKLPDWSISVASLLAEDWEVVEEPFELVSVEEMARVSALVPTSGAGRKLSDKILESYSLLLAVAHAAVKAAEVGHGGRISWGELNNALRECGLLK